MPTPTPTRPHPTPTPRCAEPWLLVRDLLYEKPETNDIPSRVSTAAKSRGTGYDSLLRHFILWYDLGLLTRSSKSHAYEHPSARGAHAYEPHDWIPHQDLVAAWRYHAVHPQRNAYLLALADELGGAFSDPAAYAPTPTPTTDLHLTESSKAALRAVGVVDDPDWCFRYFGGVWLRSVYALVLQQRVTKDPQRKWWLEDPRDHNENARRLNAGPILKTFTDPYPSTHSPASESEAGLLVSRLLHARRGGAKRHAPHTIPTADPTASGI